MRERENKIMQGFSEFTIIHWQGRAANYFSAPAPYCSAVPFRHTVSSDRSTKKNSVGEYTYAIHYSSFIDQSTPSSKLLAVRRRDREPFRKKWS